MMTPQLSFKQYYQSRLELLETATGVPTSVNTYAPKKYGSLQLLVDGAFHTEGIKVANHTIVIEWKYDNLHLPTPVKCIIKNKGNTLCEGTPVLDSLKLQKWLVRNAQLLD